MWEKLYFSLFLKIMLFVSFVIKEYENKKERITILKKNSEGNSDTNELLLF